MLYSKKSRKLDFYYWFYLILSVCPWKYVCIGAALYTIFDTKNRPSFNASPKKLCLIISQMLKNNE